MKNILLIVLALGFFGLVSQAEARTVYYEGAYPEHYNFYHTPVQYYQPQYNYQYQVQTQSTAAQRAALISQINALLAKLQSHTQGNYYHSYYTYQPYTYSSNSSDRDDDEPQVDTERVGSVSEYSAQLRGSVDMNDFSSGKVFFVYGEDEDQVADVEDDYNEYANIDEDGDDLQKVLVDSDLDSDYSYRTYVSGLDDDTEYFYSICVEFEDEDDDDTIICGGVEDFETDRD